MAQIKNLFFARFLTFHFLLVSSLSTIVAGILYILVIPIIYWGVLGEGQSADEITSLPIHVFIGEWMALIIVIIFLGVLTIRSSATGNLPKAKSYLFCIFTIAIIYLFRVPIFDLIFSL